MLNRPAHIILAFLLFISSTGLVLNKHYCQNELKSTALFVRAKACHKSNMKASCPMHAGSENQAEKEERKGCCDDQTEYLKVADDQLLTSIELHLQKPVPVIAAINFPPNPKPYLVDRQTLHYLNYKPPLIVCDLSIRFQTFLC